MWLERVAGGGAALVELSDAKAFLRVLGAEMDAEIGGAIASASTHLDVDEDGFGGLGFPLVSQAWLVKGGSFSADLLRLPFPRVTAVSAIRFTSPDGEAGAVPAADYQLVKYGRKWRVALKPGRSWPPVAVQPDAVEIEFTAGWPDVASVPDDIKSAARLLIGHFFETRLLDGDREIPAAVAAAVESLTRRYRPFAI